MFRFDDLPDDVLAVVLREAYSCSSNSNSVLKLKRSLPLLAVCKRWRYLALPVVYSTVFFRYMDYRRHDTESDPFIDKAKTNMHLVDSAGCTRRVKEMHIKAGYNLHPLQAISDVLQLLGGASGKWTSVNVLRLNVKHRSLFLHDKAPFIHADDDQQVADVLATLLPGVRCLAFESDRLGGSSGALYGMLASTLSERLRALINIEDIVLPEGASFRQLRSLDLCYSDGTRELLSCVAPDTLVKLSMRYLPARNMWPGASIASRTRAIEFPQLQSLDLSYTRGKSLAQPQGWGRPALRFPVLEHLRIVCSIKSCPFLAQAELPQEVASMDIAGPAGVFKYISYMAVVPTKSITLCIGSSERDTRVFTHVNRILKRSQSCARAVLHVENAVLQAPLECLEHTVLTGLHMAAAIGVDAMFDLIKRLPRLTELSLSRVKFEDTPRTYELPSASDFVVEPLNTRLRDVAVAFERKCDFAELGVQATAHLLLRIPTLARLASSAFQLHAYEGFFEALVQQYPRLAQVVFLRHKP